MKPSPRRFLRPAAASCFALALAVGTLAGCSVKPTFSGDRLPEAVEKITKDVYSLESRADINGGTLGVSWNAETLLDKNTMGIAQSVMEHIGDLMQAVTRVALSTDRQIDFITVSVRGLKEKTEFQMVRNVDDIRRAYAEALSVTESMNRTLQFVKSYDPDVEGMKPYRADPWTQEDFIAKLILQRVRMSKPATAEDPIPSELYDGKYYVNPRGSRVFEFAVLALKQEDIKSNLLTMLRTIREVFASYRHDNYDQIVIRDLIHQKQLVIGRSTMKIFEADKITEEELIRTRLVADTGRGNSLKNALEVFGFNVS